MSGNLSNPKPGHTTGGSGRGARQSGQVGSGKIGCQQNYSPRKKKSTVLPKASQSSPMGICPLASSKDGSAAHVTESDCKSTDNCGFLLFGVQNTGCCWAARPVLALPTRPFGIPSCLALLCGAALPGADPPEPATHRPFKPNWGIQLSPIPRSVDPAWRGFSKICRSCETFTNKYGHLYIAQQQEMKSSRRPCHPPDVNSGSTADFVLISRIVHDNYSRCSGSYFLVQKRYLSPSQTDLWASHPALPMSALPLGGVPPHPEPRIIYPAFAIHKSMCHVKMMFAFS